MKINCLYSLLSFLPTQGMNYSRHTSYPSVILLVQYPLKHTHNHPDSPHRVLSGGGDATT